MRRIYKTYLTYSSIVSSSRAFASQPLKTAAKGSRRRKNRVTRPLGYPSVSCNTLQSVSMWARVSLGTLLEVFGDPLPFLLTLVIGHLGEHPFALFQRAPRHPEGASSWSCTRATTSACLIACRPSVSSSRAPERMMPITSSRASDIRFGRGRALEEKFSMRTWTGKYSGNASASAFFRKNSMSKLRYTLWLSF